MTTYEKIRKIRNEKIPQSIPQVVKDCWDDKYLECPYCDEMFRNKYRCEEKDAPIGYSYVSCEDCQPINLDDNMDDVSLNDVLRLINLEPEETLIYLGYTTDRERTDLLNVHICKDPEDLNFDIDLSKDIKDQEEIVLIKILELIQQILSDISDINDINNK